MRTFLFGFLAMLLVGGAYSQADTPSSVPFYVAPKGNDANPGTKEKPFATLEAGRDAARKAAPGSHRVVMMAGDYFQTKPLELNARDNGLTIEAESAGKVTLYGGQLVTGWKRDGDCLWYAELPGVKEGTWDFRALIVNGRLADRACYPATNTFDNLGTWNLPLLPAVAGHWERKPTHEELTTMPYDPKDIPATLDVKNAEVRMYHMWAESLVGVTSNDFQRHALILSQEPSWPPGALNRRKYVIFNTREGMTRPGQWYLDRTAGRLVYWPSPGEDMSKLKIVAPTVERIIYLAGTGQKPVTNITLRGLTLQATTAPLKLASFGATAFDGAVHVVQARQCAFENIEICNVGGVGFSADNLSDSRVVNCKIHYVGACGAKISGADTLIANNHIHHLGVYYPSAAATTLRGSKMHIYRNEIHDAPYSGIISGGKGNLIEENLIYRVMRELHDGAAIYGNMDTCIIRGNVVRDVVEFGKGFGASAYYLDEGARDCIIERNVAQGVSMPTHNHITRNTTVRDNVFIADGDMTVSFARSVGCTFERNTLFVPGKIRVSQPNGIRVWKDNVIFRGGPGKDGAQQPFTISNTVPTEPAPGRKTHSAAAELVATAPIIDGEIKITEWPGKLQTLDREPSRFTVGGAPVLAKFAYDDTCLYVAANVTMFGPAKVSTNSVWGKDDGVEICIAGKTPDGKPATFVVRGYACGALQSSTDAGAPADAAERLGKATRFAARSIPGPRGALFGRGWRGEWAIPFARLGLVPAPNLKISFNMGAFCSEFGEWHCWEGTLAENWRLDQAGTLLLKSLPKGRPLVGAIRWDAWYGALPASTRLPASVEYPGFDASRNRKVSQDPGKETSRSLAPDKWRYRWPFFTTLNPDGTAKEFNGNSTAVIEKEIDYAVHGGLSYWAFTAYPEDCPLSYSIKTFLTCKNRDKLKFCLYLPLWPAYGRIANEQAEEAFWAHVLRMVKQPNYLKVEGNRPVFYMGFLTGPLVDKLVSGRWQRFCGELEKCGLGKPWVALCVGSPKSSMKYYNQLKAEAWSQYAVSGNAKAGEYSELAARAEAFWESCAATGEPVAPICTTGWDRRTRVMNPVSWESFHQKEDAMSYYYKAGTPDEIAAHIGRGVSWFKKHPGKNGTELVLIYAWNELDEGGWLVPALPPPHGQGTARLDALRKVLVTP